MWKITRKDLKIFFTDKRAIILSLLLPIGLITLFALAFGGVGADDEEEGTPIAVLYADEDQTTSSKNIITELDAIPGIVCIATDTQSAKNQIKSGDQIANIIIHKGYEDALNNGTDIPIELQYDQSRAMEISVLQNLLVSKISSVKGEKDADKGVDRIMQNMFSNLPAQTQDSIRNNLKSGLNKENEQEQLITMTSVVGEEESNWGLIQAVAGTAIMMLLFSVRSIGSGMLEEKENGVLKKLLQSPITPFEILFGKMLTAVIVAIFQLSVMFVFSWLAFGLDIFMNLPALIIMILTTAIACSAFGVLLASIVRSKKQADSLSTIIILFMSAIGGSMIPLYIMPAFMQDAAVISVNYWSIQGFYDIFWRETGVAGVTQNAIVLIAITAGVLAISAFFFKKNILRIS
ncbi:MAG: ABC transporter permease [Bacteroidetes bacterium]|jgi:ABC-type multidrug transport system permease subunit|nr:ABC transporter permease [Bacteroidota bacterium]MBP9878727.1 ABC transporter permease [Chitinophagales bacterium]